MLLGCRHEDDSRWSRGQQQITSEAIQRERDHDWIGNGATLNIAPLYVGDGIFEQGQRPTNEAISSPLSCKDKTLD